ncbi:MED6 mediator sub complex component-domain-containing protein [Gorgonomyces haynaldii]|nr:MED6 mediator sub complex component-domain-containing protein [Gorgonomyces haynaldii]
MHTDQLEVSFKDTIFLQQFGLSEYNCLDYFALSQFYDPSCINEQLKMQARFNELNVQMLDPLKMTGIWFELHSFTLEPSFFVVKKSYRSSPTKLELVAVYYIVNGTIYQAPDFKTLFHNRLMTSLHYMNKALDVIHKGHHFHPSQGYEWKDSTKEEKSAGAKSLQEQQATMDFLYQIDRIIDDIRR